MKKDKKEDETHESQHDNVLSMLELAKDNGNAIPIVH